MADLKAQIYDFLKGNHRGHRNAITVRKLATQFQVTGYEIRMTLRELNLEGKPIVLFIDPPYGACYAINQTEIEEYRANLVSRLNAIKLRIEAVEKIRIDPIQGRLFG